jgi:tetratricopeptide (TPR) repeat protein
MKSLTGFLFILVFSGCVSTTQQTDSLLNLALKEDQKPVRIEGVPFIDQAAGQCGPATLTMALNFQGKKVQVEELSSQVYTPGMKGTLQTDMITATRRQGLIAIPINDLESLFKEVRAGHPVIVFENLALSWWPQWHYAIVFGYDLSRETVLMHSGPEKNKEWDIRKFERSWKLGDYWGLVVLTPEELSASANELTHANAAVGLEQMGRKEEALIAYKMMLNRWPTSLTALIGLGNLAFEQKNYAESIRYLKRAAKEHPTSVPARHNLLVAQSAARKK